MRSIAAHNRIRREAINYLIKILEPETPTQQTLIYSDSLGPDATNEDETILEYLKRINED